MTDAETAIPLGVRLRLGRAATQTVAERAGVDVLHIKGDAVDADLRPDLRGGTDVDVLVRPSHLAVFDHALRDHGWTVYSTFVGGSPFGHAQTYVHALWGFLDVHRFFPGIGLDPELAFARLSRERLSMEFGLKACPVPGHAEQATILVLNAARGRSASGEDLQRIWFEAPAAARAAIESVVEDLDARIAFDAAIGELDRHRGEPDYGLWRAVSQNGTRFAEWRGRLSAEPTWSGRVRLALRAVSVNVEHLTHELGRSPRRSEIVREFFARPIRGVRQVVNRRRKRVVR